MKTQEDIKKESHFEYNPRLDNINRDILFKDKIDRAKHFLTEKGMLVTSENKEIKMPLFD